ncbi:STAS-like domain-containing protein [Pasteurella multocida]|nr:STAS-like domain-containing protein [Pasteurella canis]
METVKILEILGDSPMTRSQAKTLVKTLPHQGNIQVDFKDVRIVGQGFADQLFRVFKNEHPNVNLIPINMSEDVEFMVRHVGGI